MSAERLLSNKTWNIKHAMTAAAHAAIAVPAKLDRAIADFNLSRAMEAQTVVSSISANNPRWLAPEVVTDQAYSTAADVYSFGLILWELLTWQLPWADLGPFQVSSEQAYQGHRSLWKPAGNPIQAFVTQSTSLHWACRHCCISARQHQNAEISLQICGFCKLYLALLALL